MCPWWRPSGVSGGGGGSPTIIDSFEDQDLSEYTTDGSGSFSVTTQAALEGSYGLEANSGTGRFWVYSLSGLNRYVQLGDTYRANFRIDVSDGVYWTAFFAEDEANSYSVRADLQANSLDINRRSGGSPNNIGKTSVSLSGNTEYVLEATPQSGGQIDARILDVNLNELATATASATTSDSFWDAQGITFEHFNGQSTPLVYCDYARIV